jgi:hypothetical protein
MFRKIDKINKKLAKVPSFLWIILLGGSYILRNLWDLLANSDAQLAEMDAYMSQIAVEFTGFADNLTWLLYFSAAVAGIIGFEIILWIVYNYMSGRQYVNMEQQHFKTTARLVFIFANSLCGLIGLLNFVNEDFLYYYSYIISFAIDTGALVLMYFIMRESILNPRWQGTSLKKLFYFYFFLNGFVTSFYVIMNFSMQSSLHEIIASLVALALIALSGIAIYYLVVIGALKKERDFIPVPRENHDDDNDNEIFKGYGF